MSHEEIANHIGSSREVVSRRMKKTRIQIKIILRGIRILPKIAILEDRNKALGFKTK
jgi:DNA-binding Lrp family transcriptional regulator